MVSVGRILRDYRDAGSVNGLLALWGFVNDTTFLTKAGHVGVVYRVRGVDYEGLSHPQRQAFAHRFEAALRLLDEHCRVYQYLLKRSVGPFVAATCQPPIANEAIQRRAVYLNGRRDELYDLSLYLVLLYEAPHVARRSTELRHFWQAPHQALRGWLSPDRALQLVESELDRAIGTLHYKAQAFEVQIGEFGPAQLAKENAFRFFRELVNYAPAVVDSARLTHDTHLDYFVSDSAIDCHRDHLLVGDRIVKVLSMKEPPSQTFAFLLQDLYQIPGEFVACLEWQRIPSDRMRRDVQSRRRHFFNKRVSIVNYVSPETRPEEMLVDDSASTTVRQLGDALTEIEVHGHFFGRCSLALVLHGTDQRALQHQTAEAMKAMAVHDGSLFEETYNLLNAWLSIVPGNGAHNLRRLAVLETNLADLSFLFTLDHGDAVSPHLGQEALAVFETPHRTPYAFNLHVQDVGHTLVSAAISPHFQAWLRHRNAKGWNVYVSVNAVLPGRSRTRRAIATIRHVFLEEDGDGPGLLAALTTRPDLPPPSYVLHSSPGRLHVFWRTRHFQRGDVESLQKRLASELDTDSAATSCAQTTRLPGFVNHKHEEPCPVRIEYLRPRTVLAATDFPAVTRPSSREPRGTA